MTAHVYFWRGHGVIPILIRLFSRHPFQQWDSIPAHCAILVHDDENRSTVEYEAVVTGIRKSPAIMTRVEMGYPLVVIDVDVPNLDEMVAYLEGSVGKPYGYLAVAATGLGIVSPPWWDRVWLRLWEHLSGGRSGRTAPLDCSLLVRIALEKGGVALKGRKDGLPVSPNDLKEELLSLKSG